jgi:hypothetical protein
VDRINFWRYRRSKTKPTHCCTNLPSGLFCNSHHDCRERYHSCTARSITSAHFYYYSMCSIFHSQNFCTKIINDVDVDVDMFTKRWTNNHERNTDPHMSQSERGFGVFHLCSHDDLWNYDTTSSRLGKSLGTIWNRSQ